MKIKLLSKSKSRSKITHKSKRYKNSHKIKIHNRNGSVRHSIKWRNGKLAQLQQIKRKLLPQECLDTQLQPFETRIIAPPETVEKQMMRDIHVALKPSKIRPQDDFYSYINDKWIKTYKIPEKHKYIVQHDDFRIVQDKVYRELMDIIKSYLYSKSSQMHLLQQQSNISSAEASLTNTTIPKSPISAELLKSMRSFFTAQQHNCTHKQSLEAVFNYLNKLDKSQTVWDFVGYICQNEVISWGSPFVWSLNPDDKEPTKFRCFVDAPQITLIDINVYFNDLPGTKEEKAYRTNYKHKYLLFIDALFKNVFGNNYKHEYGFNPHDIFDVEVDILNAMGCLSVPSIKENADNYYRIYSNKKGGNGGKDGDVFAPFDWTAFSKAIGFKRTPDFFITSNPNYLKCGAQLLLKEWRTPKWRSYWTYIFIRQQQRWADKGHTIFYEFHGKFVRGQTKEIFNDIKPIYGMGFAFNTFLTNEYIRLYENPSHVAYVKNMAEDLKSVFIHIIERNKWLQPLTKQYALKKLHHFNLTVGSPPELRADPILNYTTNNAWTNLCMMAEWRSSSAVGLEGENVIDIPVMDWSQIPPKFVGTQAYVVNAAYTPSKNGIYIPLGYIQPPFVDLKERGIEYNLAHIGFTLAHEMSHSLDDWGSRYDYLGRLNNWWSEKDVAHFKHIQNDVIKQYQAFASYDGIKFDAAPSIGEDLADISGLAICREYLRDFQYKNQDILSIKTLSFEAFFVYFAFQQRQKISKRAIEAQLKSNPHPLDKYRTNVPLSRIPLFRILYNIKKGDKMWWPSTNKIWED